MSVFSVIKRGRAQAKEHNEKKAEKAKEEAVKLPYKHVVTHAASDALSGAPSSWKDTDKPRIMEQNKRRTAMMDSGTNMAGMPRVGSSLSYGSFASVYATPVVPLPRNYSYNNIPTSWREPLANFQDDRKSFAHSGSVAASKGKEPEHAQPFLSSTPFPTLSPGKSSPTSSKDIIPIIHRAHIHTYLHTDMSLSGSSSNWSASDDESETKNKAMINHRPLGPGYRSSISQQSSPLSSEKSYSTRLTSSGTTIETSVKTKRHYPPPAQSTYFSAPRPLVRRPPVTTTSSPLNPLGRERSGSTTSSINTAEYPIPSSIASIGVAIAHPLPPPFIEHPCPGPLTGNHTASEQRRNELETPETSPYPAPRRLSVEQFRDSADTITERPNRQAIPSAAPVSQKRRRRLSKSRPPSVDGSGIKVSMETVRPARSNSTVTPVTNGFDFGQMDLVQQKVEEPTVVVSPEFVRKTPGKLSKNPEAKRDTKARWTSRFIPFGSKTSAIVAH
ncbi:hypothetical protein F5Y05DRAFT_408451 [Hypoxylon sp. FL0543]|nr:hypothetical protein F5Y05DRAFT_408451 [Hypoxylon sp. FL0543]